ncbi:Zinc-finger homeodomain protein [Asimina triloba]
MDLAPKIEPLEKFPNHPSSDTHLLLSFTNGAIKRHHPTKTLYKECLKNHAAALGGHAIDGCGEFLPSPHSSPADPTSLKCAACGCHRNFHRKTDDTDEEDDEEDDDDAAAHFTPKRRNSNSPPHPLASAYSPSAPQMLLALSAGHSGPLPDADGHHLHNHLGGNRPATPNATPAAVRKRFRTKFTREQKEKMYEFAERLGWRMQRQDEGTVEEFCREIGVEKSVLKVWMHNHKNSFTKRNSTTPSNLPESNHHTTTPNTTNNNGNAADNKATLNGSSSSS